MDFILLFKLLTIYNHAVAQQIVHLFICFEQGEPRMLAGCIFFSSKPLSVSAVCADFESHAGRFPTAADLPALQERARELAADARAAASADPASAPPPRDLITEDVMPADILEEYVMGTVELPPVNAVLGGVLANEVLKAVSHKGEPVNNFFFFSLGENVGLVETLGEVV